MAASSSDSTSFLQDARQLIADLFSYCARRPLSAALAVTVAATFIYFFAYLPLYGGLPLTKWIWARYAPNYNFEHGKLIPLIFLGLLWYHRKDVSAVPREPSNWGIVLIAIGGLFYLAGARTLQARVAWMSPPFFLLGIVTYLRGLKAARVLLFPAVFLLFMIPVAAIEQATFRLQFLVTGTAQLFCNLIGIKLNAIGTTLTAADESFRFEIAEGCSGIRSLMALSMLGAVYVHLTQNKLWKKALIFVMTLLFGIIGNAGRIITIVIVAKLVNQEFAGGLYHDYSWLIFFPIAIGAMILFSKLLNTEWHTTAQTIKREAVVKEEARYDY